MSDVTPPIHMSPFEYVTNTIKSTQRMSSYIPRDTSKFEHDIKHDYYTTSYRHDVSGWGGETFRVPENEQPTVDVAALSTKKRAIGRQTQRVDMAGEAFIPNSTYRVSYVPHMPASRDPEPNFNGLVPPPMPIPDAPDPEIFKGKTEYTGNYLGKPGEPMLNNTTMQRCMETRTVKNRSVDLPTRPPEWETTYREGYCNKVTDLNTSKAITTFSMTGLR